MAKEKTYERRESGSGTKWSNRNQLQEANLPEYSKLPPQATELEEAILSALLIEREAMIKVVDIISPESFYKPSHQAIYRSMRRLFERSQPIDVLMVREDLKKNGEAEVAGGAAYLAQLTNKVLSSANIEFHARIVTEKYIQRELIRTSNEVIKEAYDDGTDVLDLLDKAGRNVFEITEKNMGKQVADMGSLANQLMEQLVMLREKEDGLTGVPTGFTELDRLTSGLQPSDLIIIAARPAMGKTSFVLSMARNAAVDYKRGVAVFSLEMSATQLAGRIFSQDAEVNGQKMRNGKFDDDEWIRLTAAMDRVGEAPIYIDDTPGINVFELRAKCRRLKQEKDISMVIIDYLQLMSGAGESNKGMNREQEVSGISRALKGLAKELSVPVIALSQLSRAVESRGGDKRPQLSDLRESGCLTGETLVTIADTGKRIRLSELVNKYPDGGFKVWSTDEHLKMQPATVSRAFSTGTKQTYKLQTALGRTIRATANHKFLTVDGWKRLDELAVKDHLALPRKISSARSAPQVMSNDNLALLGHLIGDGCTLPKHTIQYTTREKDLGELTMDLASQIFGKELAPRMKFEGKDQSRNGWYQVYFTSTRKHTHGVRNVISEWLTTLGVFGLRSHEKFIPTQVFQQKEDAVGIFLRHLWSTDGCINSGTPGSRYPKIYYASSSSRLAYDVQSLLNRLSINARVKNVPQQEKGRDQFHVLITGRTDMLRFCQEVGTVGDYKTKALEEIISHFSTKVANTNRDVIPKSVWRSIVVPQMEQSGITTRQMQANLGTNYCGTALYKANIGRERAQKIADIVGSNELEKLAQSDIYWDSIVSISQDAYEEVYDLTVPGPHNFVANGIVVHNSIEQDADIVMFLHRPEYYGIHEDEMGNSNAGIANVIIGKNRHGEAKDLRMRFISDFARFTDLDDPDFDLLPDTAIQSESGGQPYGSTTIPSRMNTDEDIPF
ncbi:replicative DNA helicase [Neolewinella antarctica]|uniref:Replicative DNA helicase n=1 Tax=Neolewinella antarctica TaxID=442734 RepID=A0ABX0XE98_9BACT|nr:replicative DNA helicase [Neolewinella antarctica]NJC27571.1 replicative DNA helicase [Neolewinella antarctica]